MPSRAAQAKKERTVPASRKTGPAGKDKKAISALGTKFIGCLVQMDGMTGEIVSCRSHYCKPWLKVR